MKIHASSLIVKERLDILTRIPFARSVISGYGHNWGLKLYKEFIVKDSIDKYGRQVWGEDNSKFNFEDYRIKFMELILSLKKNNFLESISSIPVNNGIAVNGAHRIAASFVLDFDVHVQEVFGLTSEYDYKYLKGIGMKDEYLDEILLNFVSIKEDVRILIFFDLDRKLVKELIMKNKEYRANILCMKEYLLSEIGKRRLIELCYKENDWWHKGLIEKFVFERFNNSSSIFMAIFQENQKITTTGFKALLRKHLSSGIFDRKIHSTDFHGDTLNVLNILLNRNGRNFLNSSPLGSEDRIMEIVSEVPYGDDFWAITGSAVREVHGIGKAKDLDYVNLEQKGETVILEKIGDCHNEYLDSLAFNFQDIMSDPHLGFTFFGRRFAALNLIEFVRNGYSLRDSSPVEKGVRYNLYLSKFTFVKSLITKTILLTDLGIAKFKSKLPKKIFFILKKIKKNLFEKNKEII